MRAFITRHSWQGHLDESLGPADLVNPLFNAIGVSVTIGGAAQKVGVVALEQRAILLFVQILSSVHHTADSSTAAADYMPGWATGEDNIANLQRRIAPFAPDVPLLKGSKVQRISSVCPLGLSGVLLPQLRIRNAVVPLVRVLQEVIMDAEPQSVVNLVLFCCALKNNI